MKKTLFDQFKFSGIKPISGMDSTFLHVETPTSPMHIGSVAIIEGSLDFESFKKTIASRIHMIPKLRKRLMHVPFSIDHPYWVDDPDFNLDMHLDHFALPNPGSWKNLRKLASKIFSEPLDPSKPLWSFTFVEGLNTLSQVKENSVAIIAKMHHVAIDGMGGAGILGIIFDLGPEQKEIPEPKAFNPDPLPNELELIMKSTMSFAQTPLKFPNLLKDTVMSTVKAGFLTRAQHLDLPTAPFTAPRTPLNGIISSQRKWNTTILSLDRVKRLKKIMGTTLNDVILAICSGALRKYLEEKKKLPKKPLVAMVPVSTKGDKNVNGGNELSAMLVQLATNVEDRIERLETIYDNTIKGKTYQGALGAKSLSNIAEAVPFGFANRAARLYSRFNLAKLHKPVFNVVITNVPGPQLPIYLNGQKLHSIMGMAPIIDGMGLIITVLSYNGNITISPTSDIKSMPDLDIFSDYILEEANALEADIIKYEKKGKVKTAKPNSKKKAVKSDTEEFFLSIRKFLKKNPTFLKKPVGLFQFHVQSENETLDWQLNLSKKPGSVRKGIAKNADVIIKIKEKHLMKIAAKKLEVPTAFIQGRIKMDGDAAIGMKLASILKKIPNFEVD